MTARRRVVIAGAFYGGGHEVVAEAIAEALRAAVPGDIGITGVDLLERCAPRAARLARMAYAAGEDFFPDGVGGLDDLTRSDHDDPLLRELLGGGMSIATAVLAALKPDAVVAVHPVAGAIAASARSGGGYHVATVVPGLGEDRAWLHPACDTWFVQTPEARDHLVRRGIDWAGVVASGVPVPSVSLAAGGRGPLGIPDRFTAALPGAGRPELREIASELASAGVQVVTNAAAVANGRGDGKARAIRVLEPETPLADLSSVADVVVTGPCGAAQWIAPSTGTPLIVMGPVPALEAESVRLLVAAGAALPASGATEVAHLAGYLMRHPERLASMRADAGRLGRPSAARAVAEAVLTRLA